MSAVEQTRARDARPRMAKCAREQTNVTEETKNTFSTTATSTPPPSQTSMLNILVCCTHGDADGIAGRSLYSPVARGGYYHEREVSKTSVRSSTSPSPPPPLSYFMVRRDIRVSVRVAVFQRFFCRHDCNRTIFSDFDAHVKGNRRPCSGLKKSIPELNRVAWKKLSHVEQHFFCASSGAVAMEWNRFGVVSGLYGRAIFLSFFCILALT